MRRFIGFLAVVLALSCGELTFPPGPDDLALTASGLKRDSLGVWRDTLYHLPFMDLPPAYREFWRNCAGCHSSSGQRQEAEQARHALRLDTWHEISAYGPEKLVLAAKTGGMPPSPSERVPDDMLTRVQAYLAVRGEDDPPIKLIGYRYTEATEFIGKYCADCHSIAGRNPQQPLASNWFMLDTYDAWRMHQDKIARRLSAGSSGIMPPASLPADKKPSQAERVKMLDWISRFSPNTADGKGMGDSAYLATVTTSGAVDGVLYDSAYRIINRYCADCHTRNGRNPLRPNTWEHVLRLDTYEDWKRADSLLKLRLNRDSIAMHDHLEEMPPFDFPDRLDEEDRRILTDWLNRGSPNTANGR